MVSELGTHVARFSQPWQERDLGDLAQSLRGAQVRTILNYTTAYVAPFAYPRLRGAQRVLSWPGHLTISLSFTHTLSLTHSLPFSLSSSLSLW